MVRPPLARVSVPKPRRKVHERLGGVQCAAVGVHLDLAGNFDKLNGQFVAELFFFFFWGWTLKDWLLVSNDRSWRNSGDLQNTGQLLLSNR